MNTTPLSHPGNLTLIQYYYLIFCPNSDFPSRPRKSLQSCFVSNSVSFTLKGVDLLWIIISFSENNLADGNKNLWVFLFLGIHAKNVIDNDIFMHKRHINHSTV